MRSKILGTGLTGLVGTRIIELLQKYFDFEDLPVEKGFNIVRSETIEKEVADSEAKVLIHLAAFTDVNAAWKERGNKEGLCYQVNVIGTRNIAKLCAKYKKFLIHFSTDFVFNGEKKEPYTEEDKPNPLEWYGQTKYWAEEEVKNSGCKFCILRIAFPFRAKFDFKSDLVRKIIIGFKSKTLTPMFFDQIITPTFIDDIAFGVKMVFQRKPQGTFHFVGSSFVSPYDLALKIAKILGFDTILLKKSSLLDYLQNNPGDRPYSKNLALSNLKAEKELGLKMKAIDEALLVLKRQIQFSS